jgi:hypothetical protein
VKLISVQAFKLNTNIQEDYFSIKDVLLNKVLLIEITIILLIEVTQFCLSFISQLGFLLSKSARLENWLNRTDTSGK